MLNANVVCRLVGCGPAIAAKSQAFFGYGPGPILLDNVQCKGNEAELSQCFHLGWGLHNCGHHEDAGVICQRKTWPDVKAGSIIFKQYKNTVDDSRHISVTACLQAKFYFLEAESKALPFT